MVLLIKLLPMSKSVYTDWSIKNYHLSIVRQYILLQVISINSMGIIIIHESTNTKTTQKSCSVSDILKGNWLLNQSDLYILNLQTKISIKPTAFTILKVKYCWAYLGKSEHTNRKGVSIYTHLIVLHHQTKNHSQH